MIITYSHLLPSPSPHHPVPFSIINLKNGTSTLDWKHQVRTVNIYSEVG
jgi:hypothetical protein